MPKFLNNIDLNKNELQFAVIHVSSSDPGSPVRGQIFYDSSTNIEQLKVYNGTEWQGLATEVADTNNIFNTALKVGYDSTSLIDFTTDDTVTIRVDNKDSLAFTYANLAITNTTTSSATQGSALQLISDDNALMGDDHRLGVIEFKAPEDNANTLVVGAMIESFADAVWSSSVNDARLVFSTANGDDTRNVVLSLLSNKNAIFKGRVLTDSTTDATTTTDGSLQTDGGLSVAKDAILGNDLKLLTDSSVFSMGVGGDITLTHDGGTGATLASAGAFVIDGAAALSLYGTSINIGTDSDVAIDIDSSTLDIDASGAITIDSTSTISIDGADDVNLSITSSANGEDLTIQQIGANDSSILITAAGTGTDAVKVDATAGSMLIAPSLIDGKTLTIGPSSATQMVFTPNSAAASEKISIINTSGTADDAIKIDAVAGGLTLAAGNDSLIIDADGTDADALQLSSAGGIDITSTGGAGKDINIDASGSVHIKSTESASDSIKIHSTIGGVKILADAAAAGEDIVIEATGSSVKLKSTESVSDAIVLNATLGGIDILASGAAAGEDIDIIATGSSVNISSTESVTNAIKIEATLGGIDILASGAAAGEDIDITATGSSVNIKSTENVSSAIVLESTLGGIDILASGAGAGEDIDITATGSSVNITSTENIAGAVYLRANGGASETIKIHSDQGTSATSIQLLSDVGGITLTGDTDHGVLVGTVSGGPVSIGHSTSETTVNHNLTVTGTLTATGGLTDNSGVLTILDDTTSADNTGGKLVLASNDGAALGDTHRLGVIEFSAAEDDAGSLQPGARIEATAEAAWSATENGTALEFYTSDADAEQGIALTLDSDQKASFASDVAVAGNLTVAGTTTTENTTIIESTVSVLQFEGATDNAHETIFKVVEPTADTTFSLPAIAAGDYFIAALADAATAASAAVTATEFALLDGASSIGSTSVTSGHGVLMNHGGSMAQTTVATLDTFYAATTKTLTNKTLTSPVLTTPTVTTSIVPTTANTATLGTASVEWGDLFLGDGGIIYLGSDQDVTLTHVADAGITLNSAMKLHFGDTGTYIHQSADGVLDLVSDDEIELNATTVDLNGNLDVSGTGLVTGVLTTTAEQVSTGGMAVTAASKVKFRDAAIYINSSADGQLDIAADVEVQIATAKVDLNGNLDVSGTGLVTGVLTTTAQQISSGGIQLATDKKLEFRDSAVYINSDADGYLEAVADTGISLKIGSTEQIMLTDGAFKPTTDSDVDLGTSSLYWKDAFIDKITTTGVIELGHANDTTVAKSAAGIIKVQTFDVPLAKSFVLGHDTTDVAGSSGAADGASTYFTITHGFPATFMVKAEVLLNGSTYDTVYADITRPLNSTVRVTFASATAEDAYVVLLTRVG